MEYNILPGAVWSVNLTEGNKDVSFDKLIQIVENSNTPNVYLDETDVLVLDFDLGARTHLARLEYKFETLDAIPSAVASGIEFSYKNETFETVYTSLATYVSTEPNTYEATVSGSVWSPRFLRLTHNLSETYGVTTTSGFVYGVQALNNDTVVDFGEDGTLEQETIEVARGGISDIKEVAIFNSGPILTDAFINIEPTFTELDDVISVGLTAQGPWVSPLSSNSVVFNNQTLDYGVYSTTENLFNTLRITGREDSYDNYISIYSVGTYTTNIINKVNNNYIQFFIETLLPQNGRIAVDFDDPTETIEIRYSDAPPKTYSIIKELYSWVSNFRFISFRDRWADTQTIKETNSTYYISVSSYVNLDNYYNYVDPITERWAGTFTTYGTDYRAVAEFYIFNNPGASSYKSLLLSRQSSGGDNKVSAFTRELKMDSQGGTWATFYSQAYGNSTFCDQTGYYLVHFDSNLNDSFKWFDRFDRIVNMDVDYEHMYCWYTRNDTQSIYKIDVDGNTLVNYGNQDYTVYLGGLAVLPDDQGVWFGNLYDLHRLDENGTILGEFSLEGVFLEKVTYIVLDGDGSEYLWVIDGQTVGRLSISGATVGTYDFKVTTTYPSKLEPTSTGCWVYCVDASNPGDTYIRFISKANKRIEYEYKPSGISRPAVLELDYTASNYTEKMPIANDNNWNGSSWTKVAIDSFVAGEYRYLQFRLTLRRQEPVERYDFVTDASQDFLSSDDFVQTDSTPKQILWSNWRDKNTGTGLERVYVDTVASELVLVNDISGAYDAYITTSERTLVSPSSSNTFDVRIKYRIGDGPSGGWSGLEENIYIYLYAVDSGKVGNYMASRLQIPASSASNAYMHSLVSTYTTYWQSGSRGTNRLDLYEGTLRIYGSSNGSDLHAQVAPGSSTSFEGVNSYFWSNNGTHWYINISSSRNGSPIYIENFQINSGDVYFYTDSPRITTMYEQELLVLEDLYPNTSKPVYIKTQVPQNSNLSVNNEADLKVRWRIPIN